jgi:hypothetical protein
LKALHKLDLDDEERLITTTIKNKDTIYDAVKVFLGKGR